MRERTLGSTPSTATKTPPFQGWDTILRRSLAEVRVLPVARLGVAQHGSAPVKRSVVHPLARETSSRRATVIEGSWRTSVQIRPPSHIFWSGGSVVHNLARGSGPTSDGYLGPFGSNPTPDPLPPSHGRDASLRSSTEEVRILSVARSRVAQRPEQQTPSSRLARESGPKMMVIIINEQVAGSNPAS